MSQEEPIATKTQWFSPTSGRVSSITGLVAAAAVVVFAAISGSFFWISAGLLMGLLVWMVLLRPTVGLRGRTLLLRGIVSTVEIPLSQVRTFAVRQVFAVWVDDKRYVSPSMGRSFRDVRTRPGVPMPPHPYLDHVLELIRAHHDDAKRWGDEGGGVRRHFAWPELVAAACLVVVLVVL